MLQSVEYNKVSNATKCRMQQSVEFDIWSDLWFLFNSISYKMVMMLFIIYTRAKTVTPPLPATLISNIILLHFLRSTNQPWVSIYSNHFPCFIFWYHIYNPLYHIYHKSTNQPGFLSSNHFLCFILIDIIRSI